MVMFRPELQLRAMSGCVVPLQPGSVLMSDAPVKDHEDTQIEGHVLLGHTTARTHYCWGTSDIQTQQLPRTISGSMIL